MVLDCEETEADDLNINDDPATRGIRTFSALVGVLLLTSVFANGFIIWLTTRRHFLVRWETFRLTLRYSKIIDLSLCAALAAAILWPWQMCHTGSDVIVTVHCKHFGLEKVFYTGVFIAACGVVVVCRQVCMLYTFEHEAELLHQHSGRTVRLLRDVAVVGVVCFTASLFVKQLAPAFDVPLCFVVDSTTPRTVHLFLVPAAVTVVLGVAIAAHTSRAAADCERPQSQDLTKDDLSDKATLIEQRSEMDEVPIHSRRNRLVIVTNVAVLTWCLLLVAVAMAGLFLQPVSVNIMLTWTGCMALDSVWSAFSAVRHWT